MKFFFYKTSIFLLNYMNKLSPTEIFNQLSLWIVNELLINILNLTSCASILSYIPYLHVWIQEAPEYGSNTDPDP